MKKLGKDQPEVKSEDLLSNLSPSAIDSAETKVEGFNYNEEQKNILSPEVLHAMENDNTIDLIDDDKGPAFPEPPDIPEPQRNLSVHPPEFYENQAGFAPAIEVTTSKTGFTAKETKDQLDAQVKKRVKELLKSKEAKPAEEVDLEQLDESMIMDMPEIKAASFKIMDILDPKPKDKSIRFRWANYKNFVAGNLGKYLAIGFQVASIDDIDQKRTPIDPSMIDGTQVKWYDVILIKINVIRLMELYKSNIIKSVNKLVKVRDKGLAEATRQFKNDISAEPGMSRAYNHYKEALGHEPVEFYQTTE